MEFEAGSYRAIVEVEGDTDAGTLQVEWERQDAEIQARVLPPSLRHVDDVRAAGSKLLVVGRTDQRNDLLVVYDLPSLDLLDVILCRGLVLSPSARFAVFERFYPRFGTPEAYARHLTLLYDVSATPQANRLGGASVPNFESRSFNVGYPVFPGPSADESRPYMVPAAAGSVEKDRDHTPPYAWSPDERRVAFVVHRRTESSREAELVVVEIGEDGRPVSRQDIGLAHDYGTRFIELGFVDESIRLASGSGDRKLIRIIGLD